MVESAVKILEDEILHLEKERQKDVEKWHMLTHPVAPEDAEKFERIFDFEPSDYKESSEERERVRLKIERIAGELDALDFALSIAKQVQRGERKA